MTLVVVIKNREGIVFAADSVATLSKLGNNGRELDRIHAHSKSKKIVSFDKPHHYVAAITYGRATIDGKTPNHYRREFALKLPQERISVKAFADELSSFFKAKWDQSKDKETYTDQEFDMRFCVGGFDKNAPYCSAYELSIPDAPSPLQISAGDDEKVFSWVAGWGQSYVGLRLNKEWQRIPASSIYEVANLAKSCIQEIISQHGEDEKGNKMVDGPVLTGVITAKNGYSYVRTGL
jgi:20S proteasome alpha/beta subunit